MSKFSNLPIAKKSLGQHWLEDEQSLGAMVLAAGVSKDDVVLEIGPGTGTLTEKLIGTGAQVIALEFDESRYKDLSKKFKNSSQVKIIQGDIRKFDFSDLPQGYKIVANIPYYLTANLLRMLVDTTSKPAVAVLLVQKEVAERIAEGPGRLSQIAVFTQVCYKPSLGQIVSAEMFTPKPKVDSQILVLERIIDPEFELSDNFIATVKAGFQQKRKKLITSLAGYLGVEKKAVGAWLGQANISLDVRAQELSLNDWFNLNSIINS